MKKVNIHYTAPYLLNPTNPVTVNVIGAGGTGSKVCNDLTAIHGALRAFNHPGLQVRLFDKKNVSPANPVRQQYFQNEIGLPKAECLIARPNRQFGTRWQAFSFHYTKKSVRNHPEAAANITLSCVNTVSARYDIAAILQVQVTNHVQTDRYPYYWLDFGNNTHTGQVILSTLPPISKATLSCITP